MVEYLDSAVHLLTSLCDPWMSVLHKTRDSVPKDKEKKSDSKFERLDLLKNPEMGVISDLTLTLFPRPSIRRAFYLARSYQIILALFCNAHQCIKEQKIIDRQLNKKRKYFIQPK